MLGLLGLGKLQFLAIGAAAVLIGGLLLWNSSLRTDLRTSETNNAVLQSALDLQTDAVFAAVENAQEWQSSLQELQETYEELQDVEREASSETRRLQRIFARHDLTALALAKPGLIENRLNRGLVDAVSMLQRLTSGDIQSASGAEAGARATTGAQSGATDAPRVRVDSGDTRSSPVR